MEHEDVIFVGACDLSGHMRGKAFPAVDLESRVRKGMGYTGANIMMSAFGPIYDNPFGTVGDLGLIPALGSGTSTLTGRWGNEVSDLLAGTGFLPQRAAWVRLGGSGLFVLGMAGHADRSASGRLERGSSKPSSQRYTTKASL